MRYYYHEEPSGGKSYVKSRLTNGYHGYFSEFWWDDAEYFKDVLPVKRAKLGDVEVDTPKNLYSQTGWPEYTNQ